MVWLQAGPVWQAKLGKKLLRRRQVSPVGGQGVPTGAALELEVVDEAGGVAAKGGFLFQT